MLRKAVNLLAWPVVILANQLHRKVTRNRQFMLSFEHRTWFYRLLHNRRVYHVIVGLGLSFFAAYVYRHHPTIPSVGNEEFWEMTAFGLHGFGLAPIIRIVADFFRIAV